jgi:hypothetical protein
MKWMSYLDIGCQQVRQRLVDPLDPDIVAAHEGPGENVYTTKVFKSAVEQ